MNKRQLAKQFDATEKKYLENTYYKGDTLHDIALMFHYIHVLRGDTKKTPEIKEAIKVEEPLEFETPPNVKDALKKDLK